MMTNFQRTDKCLGQKPLSLRQRGLACPPGAACNFLVIILLDQPNPRNHEGNLSPPMFFDSTCVSWSTIRSIRDLADWPVVTGRVRLLMIDPWHDKIATVLPAWVNPGRIKARRDGTANILGTTRWLR